MKKLLERDIEKKVCDYAKSKGWLTYKFNSMARAAIPDRLMINTKGCIIFVEFKQTGKKLTVAQSREIKRLQDQGAVALMIDTVDSGKLMVDLYD